tara:strand:- start:301 stop:900 length:600 start_codon:yes stop_codon:yes gene_type:complete
MSSIKLTADSGGGTFEIKAPSSSGNTRVLTLPDTGNITLGAGKLLQVVSTTKTDSFTTTSTSYTDITGLSASITPSSSSSKVYVIVHVNSAATTRYASFRLVRGSTNIAIGTDITGSQEAVTFTAGSNTSNSYDNLILRNQSMAILDTPSTTSATTYKLQGRINYGAGDLYVNRQPYTDTTSTYVVRAASTITLYEVAA